MLESGIARGGQQRYKAGYIIDPSQEASNLFLDFWSRHVPDGLDFF